MASETAVNSQITDAVPTTVNSQITDATTVDPQVTDAVTQSNVKVLGDAPAVAMASLYQTMAHATGLLLQNAVTSQQQLNAVAQAATVQGVSLLYTVDTAAAGVATGKVKK
jgi:hypothetical protein